MQTGLPAPTLTDRLWFDWLQDLGCIACLIQCRSVHTQGEIHHLLLAGRRVSHRWSVCLCPWHHRAVSPPFIPVRSARRRRGPSLANEPQAFAETYGTDEELHDFQCLALAKYLDAIGRGDIVRRLGLEKHLNGSTWNNRTRAEA